MLHPFYILSMGQTQLAEVRFIPGDRGPHAFPLLGIQNQVVVHLQQNSDSPIVSVSL